VNIKKEGVDLTKKCDLKALRIFAEEIRVETLKEFRSLGFGHVGGSMSVIETLAVLYGSVMNIDPENPHWEDRDRLVMSKGHAGPALYATLALKGYFPKEELLTLNKPGTNLPSHTDKNHTPGVDMTTGSLGQGFSTAVGLAMAARAQKKSWRTFLIVGDGECNEGQVWEGAIFAAHKKLDNLICFVDWNKKQLDGYIDEVSGGGNFEGIFEAFGWHVQKINGHDIDAIVSAVQNALDYKGKPSCIVLDTIKGKGCTIAENVENNHSINFSYEEMTAAIEHAEKVLAEVKS
jgi:transketolase